MIFRSLSQRGFSLVEVMVVAGSLTLAVAAFLEVTNLRYSLLSRVGMTYDLGEVVISNINEAKTKSLVSLPRPGQCLVRAYDRYGKFVSESFTSLTDSRCGNAAAVADGIEVFWKVSGPAQISATFEPANFLKLPKYKASILQLEIVGRRRAPPPGPPEMNLSAVIFRK